ncbi:MAG: SagB/ThcOx family dehydrogenase [Proteobacteria bacterium]|nr:SagB/ThcOx family dehydrogenase [Pseudomonadota bacterium]MBU1232218.1 SagB/ThcOx family dehydrogenase [Pseudomonadota bacterium]MBU1417095.1 SagB/ThcOx family dehydrogenase [Pseudomonadota bacterium]MBU1453791.1 SagB/ThcOx family dehydrogenase [Pseudomonadota bacterium]
MPELEECSGYNYLKETAYDRATVKTIKRPAIAQAATFKAYPEAAKVELPRIWQLAEARITPLLQKRRSLRRFMMEPIKLEELAFMLWASQGITAKSGDYSFRTAPSAGALYPVETYLSANLVEGLDPGLYHFDVENFSLDRLSSEDSAEAVAAACLDQKFMAQSAVCFLWSAVFRRCMTKYGNRGIRYVLLDAGHICQNLLVAAEATGCGGCPVAAFYDNEMNDLLQLDPGEESVLYAAAVGKKVVSKGAHCSL